MNLPTPVEITADIFNYVCERYLNNTSSIQIKKSLKKVMELIDVLRDEKDNVSSDLVQKQAERIKDLEKEIDLLMLIAPGNQNNPAPVVSNLVDTFVESVQPLVASLKTEEPTSKRKPRCDIGKPRKSKTEVSIDNEILENMGKEIAQKIDAELYDSVHIINNADNPILSSTHTFYGSINTTVLEEATKMVGKPYALEIISEEDTVAEEMPLTV